MLTRMELARNEFSRYGEDPTRSRVSARLFFSEPLMATASIELSLVRDYGAVSRVLHTETVVVPAGEYLKGFIYVLDLTRCVDQQFGVNLITHGTYRLVTEDVTSPPFFVSVVTLDELRNVFCPGVPFLQLEVLQPVIPCKIPGVEIVHVSPSTSRDPYDLAYSAAAQTLSWADGPAIDVSSGGQHVLMDGDQLEYIRVRVDKWELSDADITERVLIDLARIPDAAIRTFVNNSYEAASGAFGFPIEPAFFNSDPTADQPWYAHAPASVFRKNRTNVNLTSIQLPSRLVIAVEELTGWLNSNKIITIQPNMRVLHEVSGMVELLPSAQAMLTYEASGITIGRLMSVTGDVPNFWHFKYLAGIRSLGPETQNASMVREWVARRAALDVLRTAAVAAQGGHASKSTSRDGVSSSNSYTSSSPGGLYAVQVTAQEQWLKDNTNRISQRLGGLPINLI